MILGKRHIVLGALVIALAGAVYLNYAFVSKGSNLDTGVTDTTKNLGDAKLVATSSVNADKKAVSSTASDKTSQTASQAGSDYFVNARLNRETSRDKALEVINETLKDAKLTTEDKNNAMAQLTSIAKFIELESKLENLVKAKGFSDCLVVLEGTNADVVVKSAGLKANESMQIKDIIINTAKIEPGNIKITEIK